MGEKFSEKEEKTWYNRSAYGHAGSQWQNNTKNILFIKQTG